MNNIPSSINQLIEEKMKNQNIKKEQNKNKNFKNLFDFPSPIYPKNPTSLSLENSKIAFSSSYQNNQNPNFNFRSNCLEAFKITELNKNKNTGLIKFVHNNYLNCLLACLFNIKEIELILNSFDYSNLKSNFNFESEINDKESIESNFNNEKDSNVSEIYLNFFKKLYLLFLEFKSKKSILNKIHVRELSEIIHEAYNLRNEKDSNKEYDYNSFDIFDFFIKFLLERIEVCRINPFLRNSEHEISQNKMITGNTLTENKSSPSLKEIFFGKLKKTIICKECEYETSTQIEYNHLTLKIPSEFKLNLFFIPLLPNDKLILEECSFKFSNFKDDKVFENKEFSFLNKQEISKFLDEQPFQITIDVLDSDKIKSIKNKLFELTGFKMQNPNFYFCHNGKLLKLIDFEERIPNYVLNYGKLFVMESPEKNIDSIVSAISISRKLIYVQFNFYAFYDYELLILKKLKNFDLNDKKDFFDLMSYPRVFRYELKNDLFSFIKVIRILLAYTARFAGYSNDIYEKNKKRSKEKNNKNLSFIDFWVIFINKIICDKIFIIAAKAKIDNSLFNYIINTENNNILQNNNKINSENYTCQLCEKAKNHQFFCDCVSEFVINFKEFFDIEFIEDNELEQKVKTFENQTKDKNDIRTLIYEKFKRLFNENIFINSENNFENKFLLEFFILCNNDNLRIFDLNKFKDLNSLQELNFNKQKDKLNLNQMYNNLLEDEIITEEKIICTNCQNVTKSVKSLEINEFPNYLIFDLSKKNKNNFNFNSKNKIKNIISSSINENYKEDFPFMINLRFRLDSCDYKKFELFAVFFNNGDLVDGKYKMICRNDLNSDWIEYDEEIVKSISENAIFTNKNIIFIMYRHVEK